MRTIEQHWAGFRSAAVPAGASPAQAEDMRVAFIAGMLAMDEAMNEVAEIDDEDGAVAALHNLKNQLMAEAVTYAARGKRSH